LFEDSSYTNSRTHFWALQSLRIINECIKSLIIEWEMHDKSALLSLLPPENSNERRSTVFIAKIEGQMAKLAEMIKTNNAKQEDIRALRDGVSGSSTLPTLWLCYGFLPEKSYARDYL
jgi:hypothetical protein